VDQDSTPAWAVELMIKFERLDAKIGQAEERNNSHSDWATRNIKDFELRLRTLESFRWMVVGIVGIAGFLGAAITKLLGL
jgi:hypothetical protein